MSIGQIEVQPFPDMSWGIDPARVTLCYLADGRPELLGRGAHSIIYKAQLDQMQDVAVKCLSKAALSDAAFYQHIDIMIACRQAPLHTQREN